MQNPFKYPRQMESLQSAMSQLPSAGVYVLGAALAVAFGGAGSLVAGSVAPGENSSSKREKTKRKTELKGRVFSLMELRY